MGATAAIKAVDPARAEVQLIQIGRRELRLEDDTYRTMLATLCDGKTSSTALTAIERKRVLDHLRAKGFVVRPKSPVAGDAWQREPQIRKLRAMWYVLAEDGAVARPANTAACNDAIEVWAKRQLGQHTPPLAALRFASGPQMNKLVEELKAWLRRLNLAVM